MASVIMSEKKKLNLFLLCWLFGCFGLHRFYAGRKTTGLLMLLTLGGLGLWMILDIILILCDKFTDGQGQPVTAWV